MSRYLMPEMSYPGKNHGQPKPVGRFDYFLVAHGASGLDDGRCAGFRDFLDAVREGKEGIGGGHRAFQWQLRFHGAELAGIDAAHLSGPDAYGLAIAGVENGIRLDVLAHLPREKERPLFFRCWR